MRMRDQLIVIIAVAFATITVAANVFAQTAPRITEPKTSVSRQPLHGPSRSSCPPPVHQTPHSAAPTSPIRRCRPTMAFRGRRARTRKIAPRPARSTGTKTRTPHPAKTETCVCLPARTRTRTPARPGRPGRRQEHPTRPGQGRRTHTTRPGQGRRHTPPGQDQRRGNVHTTRPGQDKDD